MKSIPESLMARVRRMADQIALALMLLVSVASPARADEFAPDSNRPLAGIAAPKAGHQATWQLPAQYSRMIGTVSVLQVRPDIYMLTVDGVNVTVETGWQGTIVAGTAPAKSCAALIEAVRAIAEAPIRYIVNFNANDDRIGCNSKLADAGQAFSKGTLGFAAPVIAHQNALMQMLASDHSDSSPTAIPRDVFTQPVRSMHINDQAIQIYWMPDAHTNGDSIVMFRRSDVVSTGEVMDMTRFPVIDVANGGSIQGEIVALNRLLEEFAVAVSPQWQRPGGTLVIPGRGPLCKQVDVLNYRDMVTIVRDRVQALIQQGKNLAQVQAADPARGYKTRYGATEGDWTTSQFIAAVYESLMKARQGARKK